MTILIFMNEFKRKQEKSKKRVSGISLTYECNNNCIFCGDNSKRKNQNVMSLEKAKKKVVEFKKHSKYIILVGSEPVLQLSQRTRSNTQVNS